VKERSLNRGRESRPRLGSDATFFGDSCSNLEIDENFRISHNLGLGLKRLRSSSFAIDTGNNKMIFVKAQELCVSVEILGHLATIW
jgi:hypothetical protein